MRDRVRDGWQRPADRLGRQQPRVLGPATYLLAIPGLASQFRAIPGEFWAQTVNADGFTCAEISCPCGELPHVEVGSLVGCKCGRHFLYVIHQVLVANSPRSEPQTPAAT